MLPSPTQEPDLCPIKNPEAYKSMFVMAVESHVGGALHSGSRPTSSWLREGVRCSSWVPRTGRTPASGCVASDGSHPAALAMVVIPGVTKEPGDRVCARVQIRVYAAQIM